MDVFSRYAPFIQDYIYKNGWSSLRGIQVAAGEAIFETDENVLLSASTASGKTEAAFFPILTLLSENPPASVGAIYIGPLKALINDQFSRLEELCEEADIPVWHWHGDVAQSHKSKLLKNPSGILQITPESLEAMLLRKHALIPKLFGDLRFIVIDEIHSLMRGDRGGQTMCIIERLAALAGVNPRRIGLSATIGDMETAGEFLSRGTKRRTLTPKIAAKGDKWRLSIEHFYINGPQAADAGTPEPPGHPGTPEPPGTPGTPGNPGNPELSAADPGFKYIFDHTRGRKCLVFANSREECEAVTSTLRQYCEAAHEPDRFLIHHGNLSVSFRETAETAMKDDSRFDTTVTTSTLELGIDIGKLERAFQLDAPFMVSSFLQRMGRTGRRGAPSEMWFVIREEHPESRTMIPETVPWKLLQAIALVDLYVKDKWVEPPNFERLPYSLLYHQTMSILASGGEMLPRELAERVLSLNYFKRVSREDLKVLLMHLLETDHIQKTERGGIIVGLAGERVINSYKFYAVFQENIEYNVKCDSQELGTIVAPPPPGEKIAIAGCVWVVEEVDHKRHIVFCHQIKGKVPAYFGDCPGDINTVVLERMHRILCACEIASRTEPLLDVGDAERAKDIGDIHVQAEILEEHFETVNSEDAKKEFPYLMKNATARLKMARHSAKFAGLDKECLLHLGGNMWALLPWLGSYSFLALERFLKIKCAPRLNLRGFDSARPYYMQFTMDADRKKFWQVLKEEAEKEIDPMELVYPKEVPYFDKYDEYLPQELVKKGFAYGVLDISSMKKRILGLCKQNLD